MINSLGYIHLFSLIILSIKISSLLFDVVLDRLISAFILVWSNLILTSLILSLFNALDFYFLYFSISIFFSLLCLFIIHFFGIKKKIYSETKEKEKLSKLSKFLICVILVLSIFNLITVIIFSPNNWDSMTYHLPRVYLYFSQGHLGHFFTTNERQVFFPFNATLLQYPVVQYGLAVYLFSFFNLIAWTVIGIVIFRLTYFISCNYNISILSVFLGLTGTAVLAQATTTNNDILLAASFLSAIYFLFLWTKFYHNRLLLFSCIAAGIALGTKVTVAFFVPGAAVFCICFCFRKKSLEVLRMYIGKINWKVFLLSITLMLSLSLPSYYINYRDSGYLSAPKQTIYVNNKGHYLDTAKQNLLGMTSQALLNPIVLTSYNFLFLYDHFKGTAYKNTFPFYLNRYINKYLIKKYWNKRLSVGGDHFFKYFFSKHLVEDEVWYGLSVYLLLLSLVFIYIKRKEYTKKLSYINFLLTISLFFFLSYGALMKWQPWSCRFFISPYLLLTPILGIFTDYMLNKRIVKCFIVFVLIVIVFNSISYTFNNQRRPLKEVNNPNKLFCKINFDTIPDNYQLCIVSSGSDQKLFPFLMNSKRRKIILSDKPKEGYFNIVPKFLLYKYKKNNLNIKDIGEFGQRWYGFYL